MEHDEEIDEFFGQLARDLRAAGWEGQKLEVRIEDQDDGSALAFFGWED